MGIYRDKTRGTWGVDCAFRGKRLRRRGFLDKNSAHAWEAQQKLLIERRDLGLHTQDATTIETILDQFINYNKSRWRPSSEKTYILRIRAIKNFLNKKRLTFINSISPGTLQEFLRWCDALQYSHRTTNQYLGLFARIFSWAYESGIISYNPLPAKIPRYQLPRRSLPRYLTATEIEIIETAAKADARKTLLYEAIAVCVRTGLRIGECIGLDRDNVDFIRNQIILRPEQTKGKRLRTVPMVPVVREILQRLVLDATNKGRSRLFFSSANRPQRTHDVREKLKNLLKKLDIRNPREITPHTFRRTFISHMVMQGVDPVKVMAWVGHENWSTFKIYLVLAPGYLSEGADVLPY